MLAGQGSPGSGGDRRDRRRGLHRLSARRGRAHACTRTAALDLLAFGPRRRTTRPSAFRGSGCRSSAARIVEAVRARSTACRPVRPRIGGRAARAAVRGLGSAAIDSGQRRGGRAARLMGAPNRRTRRDLGKRRLDAPPAPAHRRAAPASCRRQSTVTRSRRRCSSSSAAAGVALIGDEEIPVRPGHVISGQRRPGWPMRFGRWTTG